MMRYVHLSVRIPNDQDGDANQIKVFDDFAQFGSVYISDDYEVSISTGSFDEDEKDDEQLATETLGHNENTLTKVRVSLMQCGMTSDEAITAITAMQNKGILFRERA